MNEHSTMKISLIIGANWRFKEFTKIRFAFFSAVCSAVEFSFAKIPDILAN